MLTLQQLTEKLDQRDIAVMLRIIDDVREKLKYSYINSKPMMRSFTCNWMDQCLRQEHSLSIETHFTLIAIRERLISPYLSHILHTCKSSITDSWYRDCKELKDKLQPSDDNFILSFITAHSYLTGVEHAVTGHSFLSVNHPYNEELYLLKLEWLNFLEDQFKSFI